MRVLSKLPLVFNIDPDLLEGRKDVSYYEPKYIEMTERLKQTRWDIVRLGDLIKKINYGASVKAYSQGEVPFLRIQNLQDDRLKLDNLVYAKKPELADSHFVKEGDFLISRSGTIGMVTRISKEADNFAFGSFMIRFKLIGNEDINPDYICLFLNSSLGRFQTTRSMTGGLQKNITILAIKNIKVLIPPKAVQDEIVKIMQNAIIKKEKKFEKAEFLLNEIDSIVTRELDIKIRKTEDEKTYWINATDLQDRRDALFYHPKYLSLLNTVESSLSEVKTLREISKTIASGQRPKGGVRYIEEGVPSIGGEHVTSEGDFNFEDIKYIPRDFHQKQKKSWINPLDILIVKDGATTGKVAIVPEDFPFKECNINEHVFKIEVKNDYNPYYLFSYLFSSLGQEQINRLISGAAQKGITRDAIESVKIITPPAEIQDNIADEVKRRKEESKRLKKETEEIVGRSRKEVEKMIVGVA